MFLLLINDLHLEHRTEEQKDYFISTLNKKIKEIRKKNNSDKIIVAVCGDLSNNAEDFDKLNHIDSDYVLVVLGNHDFWNSEYFEQLKDLKNKSNNKVKILINESFESDDIIFIGLNLWTDLGTDLTKDMSIALRSDKLMNDFNYIKASSWYEDLNNIEKIKKVYGEKSENLITDKSWNALIQIEENLKARKFLELSLKNNQDKQVIVLSHHAPIYDCLEVTGFNSFYLNYHHKVKRKQYEIYLDECANKKYSKSENVIIATSYTNNLKYLLEKYKNISHWLFGHIHQYNEIYFNNTMLYSCPTGYLFDHVEELSIKVINTIQENNYINLIRKNLNKINLAQLINELEEQKKLLLFNIMKIKKDKSIEMTAWHIKNIENSIEKIDTICSSINKILYDSINKTNNDNIYLKNESVYKEENLYRIISIYSLDIEPINSFLFAYDIYLEDFFKNEYKNLLKHIDLIIKETKILNKKLKKI